MNKTGKSCFPLSKKGRRSNNEDRVLCEGKGSRAIAVVADGMGGLEAGDKAADLLVKQLSKLFRGQLPGDLRQIGARVAGCIKEVNRVIYNWSREKDSQVGTTVSGAVVLGNCYLVFNVGDSRTYIVGAGESKGIRLLTTDHSVDMEAYEAGTIGKEDIGKGHYSNALTRAVGTDPDVQVDIVYNESKLNPGDILFACTDGLWNKVKQDDIRRAILGKRDIDKSLTSLYELAYKNGSKDNISMVAYRYGGYKAVQVLGKHEKPEITRVAETVKTKVPPQKAGINKFLKSALRVAFSGLIVVLVAIALIIIVNITTQIPVEKEYSQWSFPDKQGSKPPAKEQLVNQQQPEEINRGDDAPPGSSQRNEPGVFNTKQVRNGGQPVTPAPGSDVSPQSFQGGVVTFTNVSRRNSRTISVRLETGTPLKSKQGRVIAADIYYTLDGSDPTRTNAAKYTGSPVVLRTNKDKLKARVIAKVGNYVGPVYSPTYTVTSSPSQEPRTEKPIIQKPVRKESVSKTPRGTQKNSGPKTVTKPPAKKTVTRQKQDQPIITIKKQPAKPRIETVTDISQLDQKNVEEVINNRIKFNISISESGVDRFEKEKVVNIQIIIPTQGKAGLGEILGLTVEPVKKMKEIRSALDQKIKEIKFPPLTKNKKPVAVHIWINPDNVSTHNGKILINR